MHSPKNFLVLAISLVTFCGCTIGSIDNSALGAKQTENADFFPQVSDVSQLTGSKLKLFKGQQQEFAEVLKNIPNAQKIKIVMFTPRVWSNFDSKGQVLTTVTADGYYRDEDRLLTSGCTYMVGEENFDPLLGILDKANIRIPMKTRRMFELAFGIYITLRDGNELKLMIEPYFINVDHVLGYTNRHFNPSNAGAIAFDVGIHRALLKLVKGIKRPLNPDSEACKEINKIDDAFTPDR